MKKCVVESVLTSKGVAIVRELGVEEPRQGLLKLEFGKKLQSKDHVEVISHSIGDGQHGTEFSILSWVKVPVQSHSAIFSSSGTERLQTASATA